jgi:hypothetical protein
MTEFRSIGRGTYRGSGYRSRGPQTGVTMRKQGRKGTASPVLVITIRPDVCKAMKWKPGDYVKVEEAIGENIVVVKRVVYVPGTPDQWKLIPQDKGKPNTSLLVKATMNNETSTSIFPGELTAHVAIWEERDGDLWLAFEA